MTLNPDRSPDGAPALVISTGTKLTPARVLVVTVTPASTPSVAAPKVRPEMVTVLAPAPTAPVPVKVIEPVPTTTAKLLRDEVAPDTATKKLAGTAMLITLLVLHAGKSVAVVKAMVIALFTAFATLSAGAIVSETAVTCLTTAAVATTPVQAILSLLVWTVMPLDAWPEAAPEPMVTPQRVMTTVLPAVNGAVAVDRTICVLPGTPAVVPVAISIVTVGIGPPLAKKLFG